MRDPARIDRVVDLLREVWKKHPDLRLGQLVVNALPPGDPCPRIFYPEDDVTEAGLLVMLAGPASVQPQRGDRQ